MTDAAGDGPRITVIGAGIVGIACASYLQRDGHRVTVVDPLPPGEGCSFGNAGGLSPGSVVPLALPGTLRQVPGWLLDPLGPLALRWRYLPRLLPWLVRFRASAGSQRVAEIASALRALHAGTFEHYDPLIAAAGCGDLVVRKGQLYVYETEAAFAADAYGWQLRRDQGVTVEELGADEIREMEPALAPIFARAAFLPEHGQCSNPHRLVTALAEAFARGGGTILERRVTGFETGAEGPRTIHTDRGALDADTVVIAAGAWSHHLAAMLGSRVPLETQRGYHATLPDPAVMPERTIMWAERKFMSTPMEPGMRFAGTAEFAGLDAAPDWRRARALLDHGRRMFPGLGGGEPSLWMGHRPCLPDTLPVIGRSPVFANVLYAFGHGHTGLTGASTTGKIIADLATGRDPSIDVTPFRVDRF